MTNDGAASTHRRRRRRGEPSSPVPGPTAAPGGSHAEPEPQHHERPHHERQHHERQHHRKPPPRDPGERGLRDLVGAGHSQLGVSGALRGRDVDRPTDEDLAEAEETLLIVRRHWTPPA